MALPIPFYNNAKGVSLTSCSQGIYEESSTQHAPLGARLAFDDGRVFRYASNGTVALAAGELCQQAVNGGHTTQQTGLTVSTAGTAGGNTITVTTSTDTVSAGDFAGGYLVAIGTAANGGGQYYRIKHNSACSAGGNSTLTLYDNIVKTISTSATASLVANPYFGVIEYASTATGMPVGVPLLAVTASTSSIRYFFWLQTWGPCAMYSNGSSAFVSDGVAAAGAAGSVTPQVAGSSSVDDPRVGYFMGTNSGSEFVCFFLQICP